MTHHDRGRSGFTVIELMVSVVAGLVLLAGVFQVLLGNQRLHTARQAEIMGRQTQLAGMDVLFGELREISPSSGDIISMSATSVHFRAQRRFALACGVSYTLGEIYIMPMGSRMLPGDSIFVYADAEVNTGNDDTWLPTEVVDTATATCFGNPSSQALSVPSTMVSAMTADSVRVGAPIRSFERFTYSLGQDNGDWFLMRQLDGGPSVPMVGPLLSSADGGLAFVYQDEDGVATSTPSQVAQIEVTLRTGTNVRAAGGGVVRDAITTLISLRN